MVHVSCPLAFDNDDLQDQENLQPFSAAIKQRFSNPPLSMVWLASVVGALAVAVGPTSSCTLQSVRAPRCRICRMSESSSDPDMALLAARISEVRQGVTSCRLVVMDSMVPGQKLTMTAPPQLVDLLRERRTSVVVVGRQGTEVHTHGVEVEVELIQLVPVSPVHPEGTARVVLAASRMCEITEIGEDDGCLWLGRRARARWVDMDTLDPSGAPDASSLLERSEALTRSVSTWLGLVREALDEEQRRLFERAVTNLGQMPDASRPSARALWIAGLINPLPALDLKAIEV